jgi:hypothetical protein
MLYPNVYILSSALMAMLSPDKQQEELNEANSRFFLSTAPVSYSKNEKITSEEDTTQQSKNKYISSNTWPRSSQGRKIKKRSARPFIHGVEIRILEDSHPLSGQCGLFAIQPFEQFDILGEYCGEVYEGDDGSEYATYLEDRNKKYALGVDATREGNEMRFINHFTGIADEPNVIMKIAYVEELPRVMVVCRKDIEIGEEFLFKYSDGFVEEYFS